MIHFYKRALSNNGYSVTLPWNGKCIGIYLCTCALLFSILFEKCSFSFHFNTHIKEKLKHDRHYKLMLMMMMITNGLFHIKSTSGFAIITFILTEVCYSYITQHCYHTVILFLLIKTHDKWGSMNVLTQT